MSRKPPPRQNAELSAWVGPAGVVPATTPPRIRRLGHIVATVTARESGHPVVTAVVCTRRPQGTTCGTPLIATRQDLPSAVRYECPKCHGNGTIRGFEGSAWDLRDVDLDPLPELFEAGVFDLSFERHATLREFADLASEWRPVTYRSEVIGRSVRLRSTPLELAALRDAIYTHLANRPHGDVPPRFTDLIAGLEVAAEMLDVYPDLRTHEPPTFDPAPPTDLLSRLPMAAARDSLDPEPVAAPVPGTLVLDVIVRDVEPRIWRRLAVPTDSTLAQLAFMLDVAIGWTADDAFYAFALGARRFRPADDGFYPGYEDTDAVILADVLPHVGSHLAYLHDFDREWLHDILVVDVEEHPRDHVHCLDGTGACPPPAVDGRAFYAAQLVALRDPDHPDHADLRELLGADFDPAAFDLAATDAELVARCGRRQPS